LHCCWVCVVKGTSKGQGVFVAIQLDDKHPFTRTFFRFLLASRDKTAFSVFCPCALWNFLPFFFFSAVAPKDGPFVILGVVLLSFPLHHTLSP